MNLTQRITLASAILLIALSVVLSYTSLSSMYVREVNNAEMAMNISLDSGQGMVSRWLTYKESVLQSGLASLKVKGTDSDLKAIISQTKQGGDFSNSFGGIRDEALYSFINGELPWTQEEADKSWIKNASTSGFISEPRYGNAVGANVIQISYTQTANDGSKVVIGSAISLEDINVMVSEVTQVGEGITFIVSQKGVIASHPDGDIINKKLSEAYPSISLNLLKASSSGKSFETVEVNDKPFLLGSRYIERSRWYVVTIENEEVLFSAVRSQLISQLVISVLLIAASIIILLFLTKYLLSGLGRITDALKDIAQGEGDLTVRIDANSNDEVGTLARSFNSFVEKLQGIMLDIKNISSQLSNQSLQAKTSAEMTSQEIGSQQHEVTMVATAITEMSSATQEIANNAETTAKNSEHAVSLSQETKTISNSNQSSMQNLIERVTGAKDIIGILSSKNSEINSIVSAISDIAEQTNLLALNAAIEAARAGEMGRGFAVVADEVRVLSQRTHASTEEISKTLTELQGVTGQAVEAMDECYTSANNSEEGTLKIKEAFSAIDQSIQEISAMAIQIATAAEEQSAVTTEISGNAESIRGISNSLANRSEESANEASGLASLANSLNSQVDKFRL